jgi:hypothetical protein
MEALSDDAGFLEAEIAPVRIIERLFCAVRHHGRNKGRQGTLGHFSEEGTKREAGSRIQSY